jgi:glycosyltransferase involved in cell wall biosynthesis
LPDGSPGFETRAVDRPLVTVAMPVFNAGAYLLPAVMSIVQQTFGNWELLVIDDGSSDGAVESIRNIDDPRIVIVHDGMNKGLAARLNEAIDAARGRYLARMDQDDIAYPERLARQVAALDQDSTLDLVATCCVAIDPDDELVGALPRALTHDEICAKPWLGFYLPHPTWMGRIEWFRGHRYATPGPYFCEDQELLLRSFRTSRFATIPETLFAYRVRRRINWSKSVRTRRTLFGLQLRHFSLERRFGLVLLATIAFMLRFAMDSLRAVMQSLVGTGTGRHVALPITQAECARWNAVRVSLASAKAHGQDQMQERGVEPKPGNRQRICYVVASPMTVAAFLTGHIRVASKQYDVTVVANGCAPDFFRCAGLSASLVSIPIERRVSPWRDVLSLWSLFRLFRSERFDLVHSVSPKAGLLAMLAAWLARVPCRVHTFTGQVWVTRTGWRRWMLKQVDHVLAALTTNPLVDSPSQRDFLVAEGVSSADKLTVIDKGSICGIDPARFHPDALRRQAARNELAIPDGACVILFVGRLNRDKGVMDLARAFAVLAGRYPDAWLVLVGPDEDAILESMLRIAPVDRCRHVSFASAPEHFMAAADILCLPSYREGFGMVVIEAAAAGLPAVASRIYGITDAVADGETGILHAPGDVPGLSDALERLVSDPPLRRAMGEAARARALRDFSEASITGGLMAFYGKILG